MFGILNSTSPSLNRLCRMRFIIFSSTILSFVFFDGGMPAEAYTTILDWATNIGEITATVGKPFNYNYATGVSGLSPGLAWVNASGDVSFQDYSDYYRYYWGDIHESLSISTSDNRINGFGNYTVIQLDESIIAGNYVYDANYYDASFCWPDHSYCGGDEWYDYNYIPIYASQLTISVVPEPSTWSMMMLGMVGLGLISSCRLKKRGAAFLA
jgi:PEP-CTERM motif